MKTSRYSLEHRSLHHGLNNRLRHVLMRLMRANKSVVENSPVDFDPQSVRKILLIRATYRIGDAVLATPAVELFRGRFPSARIDFVGGPICAVVLSHLAIDHQYSITRRFPTVCWAYLLLLAKIRSVQYDIAIDVSCSQSAMGAFIVRFSKARIKIGRKGKWDGWFDIRLPKPSEWSKYSLTGKFLAPLLGTPDRLPKIVVTAEEKASAKQKLAPILPPGKAPLVGVFVGGRVTWGKRWPKEHFVALAKGLRSCGVRVVMFVGPEEKGLAPFFRNALGADVAVIWEPSLRIFVGMISCCQLFVSCDSGPMHLACAVRVRVIAVFLQNNFDHWGPPPELGRIVYDPQAEAPERVLEVCLEELRKLPEESGLQKTA